MPRSWSTERRAGASSPHRSPFSVLLRLLVILRSQSALLELLYSLALSPSVALLRLRVRVLSPSLILWFVFWRLRALFGLLWLQMDKLTLHHCCIVLILLKL